MKANSICLVSFRKNNENDKDDERIFQNPAYEETSATEPLASPDQDNLPKVTYDTVKPPSQASARENEPKYDVLNRGQADGTQSCKYNRIVTHTCNRSSKL